MYTRTSVILGMVYIFAPYAILILFNRFSKINQNIPITGHSLGASRFETFYLLIMPISINALFFCFLYVFILSMGYFITPALLGGGGELTISMMIDLDMNQTLNWQRGAAASFLLLFTLLPLIILFYRVGNLKNN